MHFPKKLCIKNDINFVYVQIPDTKTLTNDLLWRIMWFRYASVAQSVEQGTENPCVGGSIPPRGTTRGDPWTQSGLVVTELG